MEGITDRFENQIQEKALLRACPKLGGEEGSVEGAVESIGGFPPLGHDLKQEGQSL